jgi:hypothetical protein
MPKESSENEKLSDSLNGVRFSKGNGPWRQNSGGRMSPLVDEDEGKRK